MIVISKLHKKIERTVITNYYYFILQERMQKIVLKNNVCYLVNFIFSKIFFLGIRKKTKFIPTWKILLLPNAYNHITFFYMIFDDHPWKKDLKLNGRVDPFTFMLRHTINSQKVEIYSYKKMSLLAINIKPINHKMKIHVIPLTESGKYFFWKKKEFLIILVINKSGKLHDIKLLIFHLNKI